MTNFEALKKLSVQEFADVLVRGKWCEQSECNTVRFCYECASKWLQEEVTE